MARNAEAVLAKKTETALAKRDWLLNTRRQLSRLSRQTSGLPAYRTMSARQFLDHHYAAHRPALIREQMADWPALRLWSPDYLKRKVGHAPIQFQGGRDTAEDYERNKQAHVREMPFDDYIDLITREGAANDAYITAYNNALNVAALKPLEEDLGFFEEILTRDVEHPNGMMWIGPAGTFTPLHHDLTNNLLVQIVGRKRIVMVSPDEWPNLYNDRHVFSLIKDITAIDDGLEAANGIGAMAFDLEPGDALFIPIGWWHQVTALDFSVSITYTNFRWRNDFYASYPKG
ncbi:hypothetical protein B2G71_19100 [Novosphingobium sp. PC22D]|nr:hypothetical protein B2G71_19100 [Novosphingobium sp. PC22D]